MIYEIVSQIVGKIGKENIRRTFKSDEKDALWHEGYICSWCHQVILNKDDAEVDHIIPYSKGGTTELTNAQLLHRLCNREKNNRENFDEQIDLSEEAKIDN